MRVLAFILLVSLVAGSVARAQEFTCANAFEPSYKTLNPHAAVDAENYSYNNNARPLRAYIDILFGGKIALAVGSGDIVLDLGGGIGKAMHDLAESTGATAIVVNTQDNSQALPKPRRGRLMYATGWAEEILRRLKTGTVARVFDVFGAFTYSSEKALLLEQIYRVLKPGGEAFVLFDYQRSPAMVGDERLDQYLVANFPRVFSARPIIEGGREMIVIEVRKQSSLMWWRIPSVIDLGLETLSEAPDAANAFVPSVVYRRHL